MLNGDDTQVQLVDKDRLNPSTVHQKLCSISGTWLIQPRHNELEPANLGLMLKAKRAELSQRETRPSWRLETAQDGRMMPDLCPAKMGSLARTRPPLTKG